MQDIPIAQTVSDLPKDDRRSAERRARFFVEQTEMGMSLRRRHAYQWMRVESILSGIHYFDIRYGTLVPKPKEAGQIRGVFPIMKPLYLWGIGRLNSNEIGVTASPATGRGANAFYRAQRAQDILTHWMEETQVSKFFDRANQQLLTFGTVGYLRYADPSRGNVFMEPVPGPEIFPIPFDARDESEMDGLMRVRLMPRQWLEMQDDLWERQHGKPPAVKMASFAGRVSTRYSLGYTGFGAGYQNGSKMDGATVTWIWMKPSAHSPYGEWGVMVEDQIVRYKIAPDQSGPPLINGKLPIELVHHTKIPHEFWGHGFLEDLISPQLEANRQWTSILKSSYFNRGFVAYNSDRIDPKMVHNCEDGFVPMTSGGYEGGGAARALESIPPTPMNYETGSVLSLVRQAAREAVGMESEVLFGTQSKRTESGAATGILNNNASVPTVPVIKRIGDALKITYPEVLDLLRTVWPAQKTVRVVGQYNLGRELIIGRDGVPSSSEVILIPQPLMANGKQAMLSLLFQLRQMPSDDGKGFEVKSREMRRSLLMMGMQLPGLDLVDPAEQRIMWRIGQLINNGVQPAIPPASMNATPEQRYENHPLAIEMLRNTLLEPCFRQYGPMVQKALLEEFQFHMDLIAPVVQPDNFDDQVTHADALQTENYLDFAEQDPFSAEGIMTQNGMPMEGMPMNLGMTG